MGFLWIYLAQKQAVTSGAAPGTSRFHCQHVFVLPFIRFFAISTLHNQWYGCNCHTFLVECNGFTLCRKHGYWFPKYCTAYPVAVDNSGMNMIFSYTQVSKAEHRSKMAEPDFFILELCTRVLEKRLLHWYRSNNAFWGHWERLHTSGQSGYCIHSWCSSRPSP